MTNKIVVLAYNWKMCKIYKILSKANLYQSIYNYVNLQICLSKFMHLISYSFFIYLKNEEREWMSRTKDESERWLLCLKKKKQFWKKEKLIIKNIM